MQLGITTQQMSVNPNVTYILRLDTAELRRFSRFLLKEATDFQSELHKVDDPEELVDEAIFRITKHSMRCRKRGLEDARPLYPYGRTVIRNLIIDGYRKLKNRLVVQLSENIISDIPTSYPPCWFDWIREELNILPREVANDLEQSVFEKRNNTFRRTNAEYQMLHRKLKKLRLRLESNAKREGLRIGRAEGKKRSPS